MIVSVLGMVAHEPNGAVTARPPRVTHRRGRQGAAGTDLDEHPARICKHRVEFVGKPTVARIWRAHVAGLVASPADIHVPVRFDSNGICGSRSVRRDRKPVNSGSTGSINREWNACDVRTRRATIPLFGEAILERADVLLGPGNDAAARIVDRGQVDVCRKILGDGIGAQRHRDHDPAGCGVHQACPHRHRLDGRREVEDARDGGSDILADAVPRQCCRANTVGLDQLRQRVFHREQRRLGPVGALQVSCGPVEYLRAQVDTQLLTEPCGALIEMLGEHRLGLVEATGHPDVLSALARKQENDSLRIPIRLLGTDSPTNTLSCSAAPSTAAASCWSLTTAAIRMVLFRRRARVQATSGRPTSSWPDNSAASAERDCCKASAVRADNNSTCGPG